MEGNRSRKNILLYTHHITYAAELDTSVLTHMTCCPAFVLRHVNDIMALHLSCMTSGPSYTYNKVEVPYSCGGAVISSCGRSC
jgi:hypothetical protein